MIMAANPTTHRATERERSSNVTAYDLVIGILAIFSLIILIPIYFGNLSAQDKAVLSYLEVGLCVIFLFDFFRSLRLASDKGGYFSGEVVGLTSWEAFPSPLLPCSVLPACSALCVYYKR